MYNLFRTFFKMLWRFLTCSYFRRELTLFCDSGTQTAGRIYPLLRKVEPILPRYIACPEFVEKNFDSKKKSDKAKAVELAQEHINSIKNNEGAWNTEGGVRSLKDPVLKEEQEKLSHLTLNDDTKTLRGSTDELCSCAGEKFIEVVDSFLQEASVAGHPGGLPSVGSEPEYNG